MNRFARTTTVSMSVITIGAAALTPELSSRFPMCFFKSSEQTSSVNLAGLATVQLDAGFVPTGNGVINSKTVRGFDPASVEFHRNEQQITFRFEKDQKHTMGGYTEDPILLAITLLNPSTAADAATQVTGTTIARFYPPVDDVVRKASHFTAQEWLPELRNGSAITRAAKTNQGRGDNLVSGPPARWLVIHVDPARKVRVDLYAWQKKYSLEEARTLVRKVAESVQATPKLGELFTSVKTADERLSSKHMTDVANTIAKLKPCGINALKPGETVFSGECAAWMSDNQRYIHVARSLGRVPHPGVKRKTSEVPEFKVAPMPPGKPAALMGPPDFQVVTFFWDAPKNKWSIEELGSTMYEDEPRLSALVAAISERLKDHASVYVVSLARYDLQFHAQRVAVEAYLSESNRVAGQLRAGKLITGVTAVPDAFGR